MKSRMKIFNSMFFLVFSTILIYGCSDDPNFPETINGGFVEAIRITEQIAPVNVDFDSPRLAILGLPDNNEEHNVSTIAVEYERVVADGAIELNPIPSTASHQVIIRENRQTLFDLENDFRLTEFDLNEAQAELTTAQAQGNQAEITRLTELVSNLQQQVDAIEDEVTNAENAIDNAPFTTDTVNVRNNDLLVLRTGTGQVRETLTEVYLSITNRPDDIEALQTELMDAIINPNQNLTEEERDLEVERIINEMNAISMTTKWEFSTPLYDRRPNSVLVRYVAPDDGELVEGFGGTLRPRNFTDGIRYQEQFIATFIPRGIGEIRLGRVGRDTLFEYPTTTDEGLPITMPIRFNSGIDTLEEIQFFDAGQIVFGNNETTDNTPLPERTITVINGMIDPRNTTTRVSSNVAPDPSGLIPLEGATIEMNAGEGMTFVSTANRVFSDGTVRPPDFNAFFGVPFFGGQNGPARRETGIITANWSAPADRTDRGGFPLEVRDDLRDDE